MIRTARWRPQPPRKPLSPRMITTVNCGVRTQSSTQRAARASPMRPTNWSAALGTDAEQSAPRRPRRRRRPRPVPPMSAKQSVGSLALAPVGLEPALVDAARRAELLRRPRRHAPRAARTPRRHADAGDGNRRGPARRGGPRGEPVGRGPALILLCLAYLES